jgi:Galactose-3-O-sulfotransferase
VGHFVFGMRDLLPRDTRYVTVLREPVERTLSHYAYLVARRDPSLPELEECLSDPRFFRDNVQTRMIVSWRSPFEPLPVDALEQAKEHLERRFAFVGITESLDEFIAFLTTSLGWPSRLPMRVRVSEDRANRSDIPTATVRTIERLNALDAELHEFARGLQQREVERVASEVRLELDVLRVAADRAGGAARIKPPPGDLRARLVDTRAELVLRDATIERLRHRLARAKRRARFAREPRRQEA